MNPERVLGRVDIIKVLMKIKSININGEYYLKLSDIFYKIDKVMRDGPRDSN